MDAKLFNEIAGTLKSQFPEVSQEILLEQASQWCEEVEAKLEEPLSVAERIEEELMRRHGIHYSRIKKFFDLDEFEKIAENLKQQFPNVLQETLLNQTFYYYKTAMLKRSQKPTFEESVRRRLKGFQ